jgi:hypothetical protein
MCVGLVVEYILEVYDGCVHSSSIEGEGFAAGVCIRVSFLEVCECWCSVFIV